MSVLYILVCASGAAARVGLLVDQAQRAGWEVCVVTTPDGRRFVDVAALTDQTGHPVRSGYKDPGEPDVLPPADAILVAPATVNTINKWAAGIADTLPLGLVIEAYGKGLPVVAMPFTNHAMAAHPTFVESVARLRSWGITVVHGPDVAALPAPGDEDPGVETVPWHLALAALPHP